MRIGPWSINHLNSRRATRVVLALLLVVAIAGAATYWALTDSGRDGANDQNGRTNETDPENNSTPTTNGPTNNPTNGPSSSGPGAASAYTQPKNMMCESDGGKMYLRWDRVDGATEYNVYRTEDGVFKYLATTRENTYVDDRATPRVTYAYYVTSAGPYGQSEKSEYCEMSNVPVFGGTSLILLAALGGVGVYGALLWRKRRK